MYLEMSWTAICVRTLMMMLLDADIMVSNVIRCIHRHSPGEW